MIIGFGIGFLVASLLALAFFEWSIRGDEAVRLAIDHTVEEVTTALHKGERPTIARRYTEVQVKLVTTICQQAFAHGLRSAGVRVTPERIEALPTDREMRETIRLSSKRLGRSHAQAYAAGITDTRAILGRVSGIDDRTLDTAMEAAFDEIERREMLRGGES